MRTTMFISTLFAVTLFGGAALAERPQGSGFDRVRPRGDVVDKSYRHIDRAGRVSAPREIQRVGAPASRVLPDRAGSRVSCSDTGADCPTNQRGARANAGEAGAARADRATRAPAFLDKILGSERTSFNEAGEAQGMSSRAVKRVWAAAAADRSSGGTVALAQQTQRPRTELQASQNRAVCNEGGECSVSSKASKKEWSYTAIKAGTWRGPEAKQPSAAERKLSEMRSVKASDAKSKP
ncbi:Hypothetical protein A7982_10687 [Minicystis rosea]|nr:Hypothetical protein A7982_10687 [Minicystis rosea]